VAVISFAVGMEPAVGAGAPHGNAIISKRDATEESGLAGCIQFKVAELIVIPDAVTAVGILHAGGGPQVTLLAHPALFVVLFEVNTNVKLPEAEVAVIAAGIVAPDKVANSGDVAFGPSYTFKRSTPDSVLNEVNVTVTKSPGVAGFIVVVTFELAR
jgi:hypothetical protein